MNYRQLLLPTLIATLLFPAFASAHAVGVTCTIRDKKVEVEAYYDDDSPAHKAKVQVFNAKNEIIDAGITDEKGIWHFDLPTPGKYEVLVNAGAGHRAKKSLVIPGEAPTETETPAVEPTREEQTSTPWLRIGIGLALIVALSVAVIGFMQSRAAQKR